MTGAYNGTQGICTMADRGLQDIQGVCTGADRGAQGMPGKTQGVTGEDEGFSYGQGFSEPVVKINL